MKTLVLVEHDNTEVKDATLAAVTAASKLGEVHLLVAGADCAGVADAAAKIAGVGKVHLADDAAYKDMLAENIAPLAAKLMADHDAFVAPATTTGKNIAPRVAALLDVMQISEVMSVEGDKTFTRPIYAGNAIATVESTEDKLVLTVRGTAFDKADAEGGSGTVETVETTGNAGTSEFVSRELAKSERPELTSASVVVSGGRALKDAETFEQYITPLADKLGEPCGGRRGLRAQRLPGRPDGQDRRPGGLLRNRHFGRDPAPCRDEGFQGHRRDQQGRGRPDLPGRGHRPGRGPLQGGA